MGAPIAAWIDDYGNYYSRPGLTQIKEEITNPMILIDFTIAQKDIEHYGGKLKITTKTENIAQFGFVLKKGTEEIQARSGQGSANFWWSRTG